MSFLYNNPKLKIRRKDLRNRVPEPEQILWYWLRNKNLKGYKFRRQYGVGYYILDFYCPKLRLAIEIDGDSHFRSKAIPYDQVRQRFLERKNIKVLRFTNTEVAGNIEEVINKLSGYLP